MEAVALILRHSQPASRVSLEAVAQHSVTVEETQVTVTPDVKLPTALVEQVAMPQEQLNLQQTHLQNFYLLARKQELASLLLPWQLPLWALSYGMFSVGGRAQGGEQWKWVVDMMLILAFKIKIPVF